MPLVRKKPADKHEHDTLAAHNAAKIVKMRMRNPHGLEGMGTSRLQDLRGHLLRDPSKSAASNLYAKKISETLKKRGVS